MEAFLNDTQNLQIRGSNLKSRTLIPTFAYLITGSRGHVPRMKRLVLAIYHPLNVYLLHLDKDAPIVEHRNLLHFAHRYLRKKYRATNVHVVDRSNFVTYRGPTMLSTYLHGIAILLKKKKKWDWFINLSASDYPLVTQDDFLYMFSFLPRDLNFLDHSSSLGWKLDERAEPVIVDQAIYSSQEMELLSSPTRRSIPTSFKLFQGEAWIILSRGFSEYLTYGWDNLPRLLLMYFANFISSPEHYFQTAICNSPEFINTIINCDFRYIDWGPVANQHPLTLTTKHFPEFRNSGNVFARKFAHNSSVLDEIDRLLLNRPLGQFTPGGWCVGEKGNLCSIKGDPTVLKPKEESVNILREKFLQVLDPTKFGERCN